MRISLPVCLLVVTCLICEPAFSSAEENPGVRPLPPKISKHVPLELDLRDLSELDTANQPTVLLQTEQSKNIRILIEGLNSVDRNTRKISHRLLLSTLKASPQPAELFYIQQALMDFVFNSEVPHRQGRSLALHILMRMAQSRFIKMSKELELLEMAIYGSNKQDRQYALFILKQIDYLSDETHKRISALWTELLKDNLPPQTQAQTQEVMMNINIKEHSMLVAHFYHKDEAKRSFIHRLLKKGGPDVASLQKLSKSLFNPAHPLDLRKKAMRFIIRQLRPKEYFFESLLVYQTLIDELKANEIEKDEGQMAGRILLKGAPYLNNKVQVELAQIFSKYPDIVGPVLASTKAHYLSIEVQDMLLPLINSPHAKQRKYVQAILTPRSSFSKKCLYAFFR